MKVTLVNHMGTDLTVVNAARVSFGKKKEKSENINLLDVPMDPALISRTSDK